MLQEQRVMPVFLPLEQVVIVRDIQVVASKLWSHSMKKQEEKS